MCGSAVWSDGMETLNWHSDRFDIALNPDHDLMNEGFVLSVETKLRQKVWRALHIGTCCTTFSTAPSVAYRTVAEICGCAADFSKPRRRAKTLIGNRLAEVTARCIIAAFFGGCIITLENPLNSLLWRFPAIMKILYRLYAIRVDYCAYGRRYMKPTAIMTNCRELLPLDKRCPHLKKGETHSMVLRGQNPRTGKPTTLLGNVYPPRMVAVWCDLVNAAVRGRA